jgi:hypothetical protein
MPQKHIVISMIAPAAVAGVLIIAILANQAFASSYSYNSKRGHNDGTFNKSSYACRGHYCKISKSTRNGNVEGSKSVTTGNASQESSNTGNAAQESSNTGNAAQESSNTGNAAQESGNTTSSVPVRPAITLTPTLTTTHHITATNQQLSNNGKLGAIAAKSTTHTVASAANAEGSRLVTPPPPKPVTADTTYRVTAAEVGPGWREVHPGEQCAPGAPLTKPGQRSSGAVDYGKVKYEQLTTKAGQHFCLGGAASNPGANPPPLKHLGVQPMGPGTF